MNTFTQFDMFVLVASGAATLTLCIAMGIVLGNFLSRS